MNKMYEVERRGNEWAVYSPTGSKIESFSSYKEAKEKADDLNGEIETEIKN